MRLKNVSPCSEELAVNTTSPQRDALRRFLSFAFRELDSAMLRRLEKRILVDLPSKEARRVMIQHWLPPLSKSGGVELRTDLDYSLLGQVRQNCSRDNARLVLEVFLGGNRKQEWHTSPTAVGLCCGRRGPKRRIGTAPPYTPIVTYRAGGRTAAQFEAPARHGAEHFTGTYLAMEITGFKQLCLQNGVFWSSVGPTFQP